MKFYFVNSVYNWVSDMCVTRGGHQEPVDSLGAIGVLSFLGEYLEYFLLLFQRL